MKKISTIIKSPFLGIWLICLCFLMSISLLLILSPEAVRLSTEENGIIETASALFYVLVALYILPLTLENKGLFGLSIPIVLLFAARELDLHKAFTTGSFLKLAYFERHFAYLDGEMIRIPTSEKIISALVILSIIALVSSFIILNYKSYFKALKVFFAPAITATISIFWMAYTKLWDIGPRVLRKDFGITLTDAQINYVGGFEEMIELFIPVIMFFAVLQYKLYLKNISSDISK